MKTALQIATLVERSKTHGLSKGADGKRTRLYGIWVRMRQRCRDPRATDYPQYGGRGITVCPEWSDYAVFHAWATTNGYAENLSIDRKDVNGNYEPSNCAWASNVVQARNQTRNHVIEYRGETKTLAEWSEILGVESSLLRYRLKHWGTERAFAQPVRRVAK